MAQKKALTDEELFAQFEDIPEDTPPVPTTTNTTTLAPNAATAKKPTRSTAHTPSAEGPDPLAELESLAARPVSRPATPKLSSSSTASRNRSPRRPGTATPPSSGRTSEDRPAHSYALPRRSGESTRSFHQSFTPSLEETAEHEQKAHAASLAPEPAQKSGGGGGWWGGLFATASAAVKQAEAAVKEIQKNEEAQRWAEQVKGNVGALRGFGGELKSRALPTFTNILHTLAPPISQHERLQIHITHDLLHYPSLDPLIYRTFARVMSQVEGGDLLVIQRGSEATHTSDLSASGWSDGPWWRQGGVKRDIGAVRGLPEGTKLARVGAESYAAEFFAARGGVENAARMATQVLSETNPVRSSDIFLAVQAVGYAAPKELFAGSQAAGEKRGDGMGEGGGVVHEEDEAEELMAFAIYLHDPIHSLAFPTLSQSFPAKWVHWLDASAPSPTADDPDQPSGQLPPEILTIIEEGGVDPREWISEWIEEAIGLAVGVVAQRYVARRMGVGEGGIGRGKARARALEEGGGEAARAI
ncbi:hypothetical protein W97_07685 [Coniosporium apollinis CBS 100218]|uniref:Maintenance of telomere capping protein 1 n=1 Tax=Coniosporium apollinis (strain CBS 100218) TaxID=1168221 RepID=R7Z2Q9_CONA1|nr:uncharacterized protein W97_07685 [Coniosporium apollinis CBS 100218]EON68475.1 hypothetical protein W97_07685 [Coniosporium apollinis CBS 100218]